ncbi:MAG TPA: c-type cytochrome [Acidimicrobiales bacterium]|nr:c-type cytochrome [Acidimicrobiales bacterium]
MNALSTFPTVLAASTVTTIGATIVVLIVLGLLVYVVVNLRAGRAEVGAEIELAPNRKPYYDDDQLETTVLNRTLRWALVLLVITAVGLPLYWLNEPARMSGAEENFLATFEARGEELYVEGSQCQNCHGPEGTGGQAPYTITDAGGEFVATVNWRAPALNTVLLRFSREEVEYIINYGRPFSPMPGWSAEAGTGPLDPQQISNLIDYLASIQLTPEEAQREAQVALATDLGLVEEGASDDEIDAALDEIDYDDPATGAAIFSQDAAGGAYACARCHTRGWSIIQEGEDAISPPDADLSDFAGFPDGSGAFGPNLTNGLIPRQFASYEQLVEFITTGSVDGEGYGRNGIGSGRMPGFGDNPNTEEVEGDGMFTPEMIAALARYEASLPAAPTPEPESAPSVAELTAVEEEG